MEVWLWLGVGIIFLTGEISTSGFYLACFSMASLLTAPFSLLKFGFKFDMLFFAILTFVVFLLVRPFFLKYLMKNRDNIETNTKGLIGKRAVVQEEIEPQKGGRVLVGGENWWAFSEDSEIIPRDEFVKILKIDGAKLIVKKEN